MAVDLPLLEISKCIDHVFQILNNILDNFNAETKINLKIFKCFDLDDWKLLLL